MVFKIYRAAFIGRRCEASNEERSSENALYDARYSMPSKKVLNDLEHV